MELAQNILEKIEKDIEEAKLSDSFSKKWEILEIRDGVAIVVWLEKVKYYELVEFENYLKWLVLDLDKEKVWILILWDSSSLEQWSSVSALWKTLSIWVWENYLGRVVDGLANPIDERGEIETEVSYNVEKLAPWVITRESVSVPLETGIKSIDSMVPIGRWQRELIIWNRQTGKTTVAIDTIINQKWKDVYCIYVAIGQKESKVRRIVETLKNEWAMDYTIVVNAPANSPAVLQYLAPYVWCSLWEYFMDNGKDALIIYDDLSKHAVAYREVSLLLKRPPGREAYPWDVFYLHSRLLERAARLNKDYGGWSLTALPIIETMDSDVSAYVPTNVISITDGQIFLETDLFNSWIRPAINVWLSVSRVWGSAQTKIMKKVAWTLRLELATFRELASFAQFGSDLDESTQKKIEKWKRLVELLKQPNWNPIPFYKQVVLIFAWVNDYLNDLKIDDIKKFEENLYDKLDTSYSELKEQIKKEQKLTDDIKEQMKNLIKEIITQM